MYARWTGQPMTNFRITDNRVSTLYPSPNLPPTTRSPRVVLCYEVLANPDAHDSRRCYGNARHEGIHAWETCPATDDLGRHGDGDEAECDRPKGHEPPHRFIHEW